MYIRIQSPLKIFLLQVFYSEQISLFLSLSLSLSLLNLLVQGPFPFSSYFSHNILSVLFPMEMIVENTYRCFTRFNMRKRERERERERERLFKSLSSDDAMP